MGSPFPRMPQKEEAGTGGTIENPTPTQTDSVNPERLPVIQRTLYQQDFPRASDSKGSACNAGDQGSIPGSGRSPGKGIGYPLQYSWVFLVAQTVKDPPEIQETGVQSPGKEDLLEKATATHSNILAWRIAWTEEPGGLWSMGWQRVRHDWTTNTLCTSNEEDAGFILCCRPPEQDKGI